MLGRQSNGVSLLRCRCTHQHPAPTFYCLYALTHIQAEAAASSDHQRLSGLNKALESQASADSDALRRLQESLAAQQEELSR